MTEQAFYCKRCLGHFKLESAFERHQQLCTREDYISTLHILPEPDTKIKFVNWKYKTWAPFVIYADLESLLLPVDRRTGSTHLYQNHQPCAASALLCSTIPAMDKQFYLFTGENSCQPTARSANQLGNNHYRVPQRELQNETIDPSTTRRP